MTKTRTLTTLAVATALTASAPAFAASEREDLHFDAFVKSCDADGDGMVSKAEMMKVMEKMFDKHDTKKAGKLDKKQVEFFLRELMKQGG